MIAFESLEKKNLLSVVVAITNTEIVQVTNIDEVEILTPPVYGELSLDQPNNKLDYIWHDGDASDSFIYSPGWSEEVIDVILTPSNNSPTAVDDLYATQVNARMKVKAVDGILANDLVPENDALVDLIVNVFPEHGRLTMSSDGSFFFKPDKHYIGADSFGYTVSSEATSPDRSNPANVKLIIGDTLDAYDYYFTEVVYQNTQRNAHQDTLPLYVNYYNWQI